MNKTLKLVALARKSREMNRMHVDAKIYTEASNGAGSTEAETMKISGKIAFPHSLHVTVSAPNEGEALIYSHEGQTFFVTEGQVNRLNQAQHEELVNDLSLEQISMTNFMPLILYAEEMDFQTDEKGVTTISYPKETLDSEFSKELMASTGIKNKAQAVALNALTYEVSFNEAFELLSVYVLVDVKLIDPSYGEVNLIVKTDVTYSPLEENEDFAIPQHICEAN